MADLKALAALSGHVTLSNGTKVPVRGLSLTDVIALANEYRDVLSEAFDTLSGADESELQQLGLIDRLLKSAPRLAGQIILKATDSEDTIEDALNLAAGLQVEILQECGRQTFVTEGGLGKILEIVIGTFHGTTELLVSQGDLKA